MSFVLKCKNFQAFSCDSLFHHRFSPLVGTEFCKLVPVPPARYLFHYLQANQREEAVSDHENKTFRTAVGPKLTVDRKNADTKQCNEKRTAVGGWLFLSALASEIVGVWVSDDPQVVLGSEIAQASAIFLGVKLVYIGENR